VSDPSESFATPRVAAGALFFGDQGRVLLVHPTYKDTWDIPGGYVECGIRLDDYVTERIARRVRTTLTSSSAYREHGRSPGDA